MTYFTIIATISVVVTAVIIGQIWCGDVTNIRQSNANAWPQVGENANKNPLNVPPRQPGQTTTPWPALGQSRRQTPINMPQSSPQQATWVRPSGSVTWVRNTPPPNIRGAQKISGNTQNYNTDFLNVERGQSGLRPQGQGPQRVNSPPPNSNQKPNTISGGKPVQGPVNTNVASPSSNQKPNPINGGKPVQGPTNKNLAPSMPLVASGGSNNGNKVTTAVPTGPKSDVETFSSQDEIKGSNTPSSEGVEDYELREFSEELLSKDTNNAARFVTVNLQGMTTSRSTKDEAALPLLSVNQAVYNISTIEKLMLLYNNYILEAGENEVYTAQEKIEENNLLDAILSTPVMQHTRNFLIKKGKIGKDPKDFKDLLRLIWFNMYSRGRGRIGSSGFEHVFLAELKNDQVSGLHNWLYFNAEENKNNANYLGYMKKIDLGNKGSILKHHFTFHGVDKPVGSMFIGTSPELEIALYSTCFILRADRICPLKLNGNRFIIRTFTFRYRGKNTIGSAFPEI